MVFVTVNGKHIVSAHVLPFSGVDPDLVLCELSSSSTFSFMETGSIN
jgi:hypothetical protein